MVKSKTTTKASAKIAHEPAKAPAHYFEGLGRRKTAVARVRIIPGSTVMVNDKDASLYFVTKRQQEAVRDPFRVMGLEGKYGASVKVSGGGINAQAEAVRHGLSRALVIMNPDFKKKLRRAEFLTRDPRMVERKKYGLKKARRAPQWKKR